MSSRYRRSYCKFQCFGSSCQSFPFHNGHRITSIFTIPAIKGSIFNARQIQQITARRPRNNFRCNQTIQITRILISVPNQTVSINAYTRFCSLCKQLIYLIKFQIPFRIDHRTVLHGISYRQIIKVLIHNGSRCLVTKIFIHPHSDTQLKVGIG